MPKNKDPAVLFYTSDFLVGVAGLTMEERGQYITLLCLQHTTGHLTKKQMQLAVGKISPDVMAKFEQDEKGLYYNPRMEYEKKARESYVAVKRENGSKGGRPKKPIGKPNENLSVTNRLTETKPNENLLENENINENINKPITDNLIFPFSTTTTTTTTTEARTREENDTVMVALENGKVVPLTEEMLAEMKAQNALEKQIRDYFDENHYFSSVELFIEYNRSRGWVGHNDVDIRINDRWILYADAWEREERRRKGLPNLI